MSKVLYIKGHPLQESASNSLTVGRIFKDEYKKVNPQDEIKELDLYKEYIPLIDEDIFAAWGSLAAGADFNSLTEEQKKKLVRFNELTDEFLEYDKYVFATPVWNFSVPPIVKAYIDTICVAGKTFRYTEAGPVGLLGGKKLLHIQASGSVFSEGPAAAFEHGASYIKAVAGFIGINDAETFYVEGHNQYPDRKDEIIEKAKRDIVEVAKRF